MVDHTNMRRNWWQLRKGKSRVQRDLTNNGDNSFTASYTLSSLPNGTSWNFTSRIEDKTGVRYSPATTITVN